VEVDMYGLPADSVRKKFRTRIVRDNSLNPVYGDEPFVFKKVVLPHLASLRIAAYEENGKFLGHRILPVIGLCPGYRHLTLRNEIGQPTLFSTLFLCIVVKDYVPDGLSDFAEALANPIKYQSDLEKRSAQLAVLQEDMEPEDEGAENCKGTPTLGTLKKEAKPTDTASSSPKHRSSFATSAANDSNVAETLSISDQNNGESSTGGGGGGYVSTSTTASSSNYTNANALSSLPAELTTTTMTVKSSTLPRNPQPDSECEDIVAETLEKILEHKSIREKREALEKKIRVLKKSHDKKKVELVQNEISDGKKSSINKLVKKLSSKNM
jgi:phosphatidylinositol phospholipase C, beta